MITGQGGIRLVGGVLYDEELKKVLGKLKDGVSYSFLVVDDRDNRQLPNQQYLFSVVLKCISDQLPDHPPTISLYRYFEKKFAPHHTCTVNGEQFEYCDAKSERKVDFDGFIERIIEYSQREWGIEMVSTAELRDADAREFYSMAYKNQLADWNSFISSRKNK